MVEQMVMTRAERLRQASDGSADDERLLALILARSQARGELQQRRSIAALIAFVEPLLKRKSGKWQHARQEAEIVYTRAVEYDPLLYLSLHIDEFMPQDRAKSLIGSLIKWLEFNAVNKGVDEFNKGIKRDLKPLHIDAGIVSKQTGAEIDWEIPDDKIEGLAAIIDQVDADFLTDFLPELRTYVTTDPDGKLVACCMTDYPHCNALSLVELLYFPQPPLNLTKASIELGVNYHGMRSHWLRSCLKLLKEISLEIAAQLNYEFD
jgi:hypothetical protein